MRRLAFRMSAPIVALVTAVVSAPAAAELAKWDQTRVTGIAQQLAAACDAWEQAVRRQPGGTIGSGAAESDFDMAAQARVLREQSASLAAHLRSGKSHDQTVNEYRDLKEVADDTEVAAQRAFLDEPTMDAWAKVADLMRQIAPYYDPKALGETGSPATR